MARVGRIFKWIAIVIVVLIAALVAFNSLYNKVTGPPAPAATVSDLRSLNTALHTYQSRFGHYPDALQDLGVAASGPSGEHGAGLIGSKLARGSAHGYSYTYTKSAQGYSIHANPEGTENNMHLFTDETSEVRFQRKKPAERSSDILQ
jgi:type II secretory pathway pseudopilin PulG